VPPIVVAPTAPWTTAAARSRGPTLRASGEIAKRDCVLSYYAGDTRLAVASIFRDRESLEAEVAMEQQAVTT